MKSMKRERDIRLPPFGLLRKTVSEDEKPQLDSELQRIDDTIRSHSPDVLPAIEALGRGRVAWLLVVLVLPIAVFSIWIAILSGGTFGKSAAVLFVLMVAWLAGLSKASERWPKYPLPPDDAKELWKRKIEIEVLLRKSGYIAKYYIGRFIALSILGVWAIGMLSLLLWACIKGN